MDVVCALCFWVAMVSTCLYVPNHFFLGLDSFGHCQGTCGATVSATLVAGVSLVSIPQAGDWASDSTAARYYFLCIHHY